MRGPLQRRPGAPTKILRGELRIPVENEFGRLVDLRAYLTSAIIFEHTGDLFIPYNPMRYSLPSEGDKVLSLMRTDQDGFIYAHGNASRVEQAWPEWEVVEVRVTSDGGRWTGKSYPTISSGTNVVTAWVAQESGPWGPVAPTPEPEPWVRILDLTPDQIVEGIPYHFRSGDKEGTVTFGPVPEGPADFTLEIPLEESNE